MSSRFKGIFHLELVKVGILNSVAVAFKMSVMFGINKILAIYIGPSGYALVGQFQNFVQIISAFGGGAINTGVTKYTAEYDGQDHKQQQLWSTAFIISTVGAILTLVVIITFRENASIWLLNDEQFSSVFIWLGLAFVFLVFNALFLAILNGKQNIELYVLANISGSITAFLITLYLTSQKGLWGALVALSIYQAVAFFTTVLILRKTKWFKINSFLHKFNYKIAKNLYKYILMAVTGALCAPLANMIVRSALLTSLGSLSAGYWDAMNRLSSGYLLMFTSALTVYFLPKFSRLGDLQKLKNEIKNGYIIVLPFVVITSMGVYFFRDAIISILFTEDFLPIEELFSWFMIGDIFKIGSWILSFFLLSKAMTKVFIILELTFTVIYISLNLFLINTFGLIGTAIAYAFTYLFYWITMHIIIKNYFNKFNNI